MLTFITILNFFLIIQISISQSQLIAGPSNNDLVSDQIERGNNIIKTIKETIHLNEIPRNTNYNVQLNSEQLQLLLRSLQEQKTTTTTSSWLRKGLKVAQNGARVLFPEKPKSTDPLANLQGLNRVFERMVQVVNIAGQVDSYITDRWHSFIKKIGLLFEHDEEERRQRYRRRSRF